VDNVYGSDRAGVVSVNGGRGRDNNYSVNGGDETTSLPICQPSSLPPTPSLSFAS